ncbi:hypothetical protein SDC9_167179 [bioreactor metagenome]|uniref:Uncharacterized protein n=1 Tax=bioreactor metagenome TaxID=1076179 RepID=A0A645FZ42_9ZZZZ
MPFADGNIELWLRWENELYFVVLFHRGCGGNEHYQSRGTVVYFPAGAFQAYYEIGRKPGHAAFYPKADFGTDIPRNPLL